MNTMHFVHRLTALTQQIGIPAWGVIVYHKQQEVLRYVSGFSDLEGKRPTRFDDEYWLYSLTKLSTVTAAMQLIERGMLALDDRVEKYLPAFGRLTVLENGVVRPAATHLRVIDLFTMRGGFDYTAVKAEPVSDPNAAVLDALAKRPLCFDPGTHYRYSLCHDVLAGVITAVSGMPYAQWLKREMFEPLQMTETRFAPDEHSLKRLSAQYVYHADGSITPYGQGNSFVFLPGYISGGAGLASTLTDYILLVNALANGGMGASGEHILKAETVQSMCQNRLSDAQLGEFSHRRFGYGYGLGVRVRSNTAANPMHVQEFGWDGAAGGYALCDLTNQLAILYLQHVLNCAPAYEIIHQGLRNAAYEALML